MPVIEMVAELVVYIILKRREEREGDVKCETKVHAHLSVQSIERRVLCNDLTIESNTRVL